MKLVAFASALLGWSHAFTAIETGMLSNAALQSTLCPDSSDATEDALKMSKEYGANSRRLGLLGRLLRR